MTVGHIIIGWRVFMDWRVVLETVADGAPAASLAIGMPWGDLEEANVW